MGVRLRPFSTSHFIYPMLLSLSPLASRNLILFLFRKDQSFLKLLSCISLISKHAGICRLIFFFSSTSPSPKYVIRLAKNDGRFTTTGGQVELLQCFETANVSGGPMT